MKKLRKALIVSVMFMTVLSMSVVAAPNANAAASAGDLIKMDGLSTVYYLAADGKRYVFPNETTYFSWYGDFSSVVVIPQSELESYSLGANVTIRPGTKLVKITTDPKVYAVEPGGELRWIASETAAETLFGSDWIYRVVDVPDYFIDNYKVNSKNYSDKTDADVEATKLDGTAYPAGSLIKTADSADIYYVAADGTARKIADEAAMSENRFENANVITTTLAIPTAGADIAGAESDLTDTSSGAGGVAGAGSGLTVALAGDTPAAANLPSLSTLVPVITVNLTSSNDGDVTVQNMVFVRTGTGNASDFDGGYLFVGDDRLSNKRSVNTSDNKISFSALNLDIPSGMTKAVTLKMNSKTSANGNHAFKLSSASDISTNGAAVSGSFPVTGNTMVYSSGVDAATVTITSTKDSIDRKVGETNVSLSEFDIANNGKEIVNVYRIRLKQEETAGNNAVNNLSLELDGTEVATGISVVDKYVDFVLDTPFEIKKSKTITAVIRGDVITDIGKKFQLYLKNVADVDVRGTAYGDFYSATISNSFTTDLGDEITIKGSEINVSFDGPAAADTKDDQTDLVLANFSIGSANEDVDIDTLTVTLATGGAANDKPLQNIEMVDSVNNVSYSVADPASSTSVSLAFDSVYLTAGKTYNFEIRGDVQDGAATGATYQVSIDFSSGFTATYVDSDTAVVAATDVSSLTLTGKTMTVAAPSITTAKVTTNASTVVKDADGVLLYKGKFTANNVDDLKVTKVGITGTIGDLGNNFDQDWNKLYLYKINSDSTETLLDSETSLGATAISFTSFTLNIPKGVSNGVQVAVRGDVKSSPIGTTTEVALGASSTFTVKDSDNNAVTSFTADEDASHVTTVATKGTVTMTMDTDLVGINNDKNVVAGAKALVGRLKITAANEAATLEDLVIKNSGDAQDTTMPQVYLYSDEAMTNLLGTADFASGATPKALFEDINVNIPKTGSTYLYLASLVKAIDYSSSPSSDATGVTGKTIILNAPVDATGYTTKFVGVDTGETLTSPVVLSATGNTKTATVMGAVLTSITSAFANDTSLGNGPTEIFSIKYTASPSGNIDVNGDALSVRLATTTFALSRSTALQLATFTIERVGGSSGAVAAVVDGGDATATSTDSSTFAINLIETYGTDSDGEINPEETAEYLITATISGASNNQSMKVTVESVDSNVTYTHTTTSTTTYTTEVAPRISGLTSVRAGNLSN